MKRVSYILAVQHGELPAGATVQPIRYCYLDRDSKALVQQGAHHLKPIDEQSIFQSDYKGGQHFICHTALGLMLIPAQSVKERG